MAADASAAQEFAMTSVRILARRRRARAEQAWQRTGAGKPAPRQTVRRQGRKTSRPKPSGARRNCDDFGLMDGI